MTHRKIILGAAAVASALSAGVFFTFSVAVNPAFRRLPNEDYVRGMQKIDKHIQNPLFFAVFMGPILLLPLAAYTYKKASDSATFKLLLAASLVYSVGVFGVTAGANVPLNDKLASVPIDTASKAEIAAAREAYEGPWGNWHTVRTVSAVVALSAIVAACLVAAKNTSKE